jgi:plasmid replication initiation protein
LSGQQLVRVGDRLAAKIKSLLSISYTQRKTGCTVTHLIFDIRPEATPVQVKRNNGTLSDADIAKQSRPGESWEAARARLFPPNTQG